MQVQTRIPFGTKYGHGNISVRRRIYRSSALWRAPGRSVGRSVRPIDRYRKLSVMSLRRLARNTPDSARSKAPPCVHARSPVPWLRAVISHCGKCPQSASRAWCSRRGEISTKCLLRRYTRDISSIFSINSPNIFFTHKKHSFLILHLLKERFIKNLFQDFSWIIST